MQLRKLLTWSEVAYTVFYLIFYTGGPIFLLLSNGYSEGQGTGIDRPDFDFSLARNAFLANYVVTGSLLALRWKQVLKVVRKDLVILCLVLLAGLSLLWSVEPAITQNRSIALLGTTLFGLYLASRFSLRQQCYIIASAFGLAVILSFIFAVFLPDYGIMGGAHVGAWRGIYTHKNQLGRNMVFVSSMLAILTLDVRQWKVKLLLCCGVAASVCLLILSQSTSALINASLLLLFIPVLIGLRLKASLMVPSALTVICLVFTILPILAFNAETILGWFQKDVTLTGRTELWSLVIELIGRRPWFGYGFSGFWESGLEGPVAEVWRTIQWRAPSSHNMWLEVALEMGLIGLLLSLLSVTLVSIKAVKWVNISGSAIDYWPIIFIASIFISGFTESSFVSANNITWVLYSAVAFTLASQKVLVRPELAYHIRGLRSPSPKANLRGVCQNSSSLSSTEINVFASPPPVRIQHNDGDSEHSFGRIFRQYDQSSTYRALDAPSVSAIREDNRRSLESDSTTARTPCSQPSASNLGRSKSSLMALTCPDTSFFSQSWRRFRHISKSSFAKDTSWVFITNILRLFIQAAYFIIVARALGVEQYGAFVGIAAFSAILGPFANAGSADLLIKDVSRNRLLFSSSIGNSLAITVFFSLLLATVQVLIVWLFLPLEASLLATFCIALSDLCFAKFVELSIKGFSALGIFSRVGQLSIILSFNKLLSAFALIIFFSKPTLILWSLLYLLATILSAFIALFLLFHSFGQPKLDLLKIRRYLAEGVFFSINLSANTIYNDLDKTMLASLDNLVSTGSYGVAYRLIMISLSPISSLMTVAYRKFFQMGEKGISGSLELADKLVYISGMYGFIASVLVFLIAPFIPSVLGPEYSGSVEIIRWLSPYIFMQSIRYLGADALTGAGFQKSRSIIQITAAIFNVLANFILIPAFSWKGAVWSTLLAEIFLLFSIWGMIFYLRSKESRAY